MAERSVKVRLWASTSEYEAAMKRAKSSTSDLATSSGRDIQKLGTQMTDVGRKVTRGVTLPLVGVGVAAVKLGNDFDSAFASMVGLAGVAAEDVDGLKESVLDLAGETARAPTELAEALYFAASAGLDTKGAMDAVTVAAKASAAGLGSTQDVVGLVASAVASYGEENINAAEATDILTATIREGRAEPAELAGTLGRILPIAASLGLGFEEVGGTVAYLSNVFGDTNRTVTATQGLMVKLMSPTQQGRDALADMGTSVEELHAAIASDGLLGALELLRSKGFDENREAVTKLFDDIEGRQAAIALLSDNSGLLAENLDNVGNAAGATDEAFGALDEDSQSLKQAWVDVQIALIEIGDVLGPIIADIAGGVSGLASTFSDLPPSVQKVAIGLGALAAAGGPALMIGGSLLRNYQQISSTWSSMGRSSRLAVGALGGVGLALSAAALIYNDYNRKKQIAKQRTDDLTAALEAERNGQEGATDVLLASTYASDDYRDTLGRLGISIADVVRHIQGENVPAVAELIEKYNEADSVTRNTSGGIERLTGVTGLSADAFADLVQAVELDIVAMEEGRKVDAAKSEAQKDLAKSTDTSAYAAKAAAYEQELLARATTATGDAADETALSEEELAAAEAALEEQVERTARAQEVNAERTERAREAHERLVESILNSMSGLFSHEQAVLRTENAYLDYTAAVIENEAAQKDAELTEQEKIESANNLRLQELALAEQARDTAEAYAEQSGAVEGTKEWADLMTASLEAQADQMPELRDEIQLLIDKLNAIPAVTHAGVLLTFSVAGGGRVTVNTQGDAGTIGTGGRRAHGGPTHAGSTYEVLEGGKSEILHENGRSYLMAANNGYVTPLGQGGDGGGIDYRKLAAALGDTGSRTGVRIDKFVDQSGHALDDVFRTANAFLALGV